MGALDGLVPDEHDQYWQLTLRFLEIAREKWPAHLGAHGKIEPVARRDLLIAAEAARLSARMTGPVIAAGSTGSMPATAAFSKPSPGCPRARWCCPVSTPISTTLPGN